MQSDRKLYKIVRRDLLIAVKRARTLDDLLVVIKRKFVELKGSPAPNSPPASINITNLPPYSPPPFPYTTPTTPPVEPEPSYANGNIVRCNQCGELLDLSENILFCSNCGSPLK